jgi:hypothetical protein
MSKNYKSATRYQHFLNDKIDVAVIDQILKPTFYCGFSETTSDFLQSIKKSAKNLVKTIGQPAMAFARFAF